MNVHDYASHETDFDDVISEWLRSVDGVQLSRIIEIGACHLVIPYSDFEMH